ncbi:NAD(P)H-dependent oxidoreductase [Candidatus Bipolaricaulota bacterium]|nr:NAD(P)H-dependent oxidoreductase [Candidatus Bipolaricaulota bacterium]
MNVLAINGSPRGQNGNTDILVQAFLSGVRLAGGSTNTVYLHDKTIHYCTGCFACWTRTPGVCIHQDDMIELLPMLRQADIAVIASPLYGNMLTGQMKTFLDRTLPLSNPAIVEIGDEFVHPPRYDDGVFRVLLICNAGFPETHHFEGLKKTFEISTSGPRSQLAGMICCAAGPMLSIPGMQDANRWYLDAVIQAGKQVVESGFIAAETQSLLDRSLADKPGEYANLVNAYWERISDSPSSPIKSSPVEGGIPIAPSQGVQSVRDLLSHLPDSFSADAAGKLAAVIQFAISDEEPGAYYLAIHDGICSAFEGVHASPTMTIHSPAQVWMDVCMGRLDGAGAYMAGKYRATGDMSLLMRFGSLFSERRNAPA